MSSCYWASLVDRAAFGYRLEFACNFATLGPVLPTYDRTAERLAMGLPQPSDISSWRGTRLQIGSVQFRAKHRWLKFHGLAGGDGRRFEFHSDKDSLPEAQALEVRVEPGARVYRALVFRQPVMAMQSHVRIECEDLYDQGQELLGLLAYLWTGAELERTRVG